MELMPNIFDGLGRTTWTEIERTPAPQIKGDSEVDK